MMIFIIYRLGLAEEDHNRQHKTNLCSKPFRDQKQVAPNTMRSLP